MRLLRSDPDTSAITSSPSRMRVDVGSFSSRTRLTHPSRVTTTCESSSEMKASSLYSTSSTGPDTRVRRLSTEARPLSISSSRTRFQRARVPPLSVLSSSSSRLASARFSFSSF
jgi:hypothetical protein